MPNHIPERSCVICRKKTGKENLLKLVKTANGVMLEKDIKLLGRGAYVCKNEGCIAKAKKSNLLSKVFKCSVSESVYEELENELKR